MTDEEKRIKNIKYMIEIINDEGRGLTKWEEDFMESIIGQFERKNWLSERQEEILQRIYDEKTP